MYDLNFFAAPVKSVKRSMVGILGVLALILVIAVVAAFYFLTEWRANGVRQDIGIMKDYIASDVVASQLANLEITKQKSVLLKNYQTTFSVIDRYVRESELIDSSLLKSIAATVPASVSFKTFNLSRTEVLIDSTAATSQPVAEFLYNLKQTGLFSVVELLSVTNDQTLGGEQIFTIRCILKEVVTK
ncbi:MAG TPA: PilN domain-containing protein [Clostridia bacterium]